MRVTNSPQTTASEAPNSTETKSGDETSKTSAPTTAAPEPSSEAQRHWTGYSNGQVRTAAFGAGLLGGGAWAALIAGVIAGSPLAIGYLGVSVVTAVGLGVGLSQLKLFGKGPQD